MSNFITFTLSIILVFTSNLYYLGALNTSFPAVVNMSAETFTYSREQLLKFQHSEQRGNIYDWSHIYSIVKPREHPASVSPTRKPQATYYKTHQQKDNVITSSSCPLT